MGTLISEMSRRTKLIMSLAKKDAERLNFLEVPEYEYKGTDEMERGKFSYLINGKIFSSCYDLGNLQNHFLN